MMKFANTTEADLAAMIIPLKAEIPLRDYTARSLGIKDLSKHRLRLPNNESGGRPDPLVTRRRARARAYVRKNPGVTWAEIQSETLCSVHDLKWLVGNYHIRRILGVVGRGCKAHYEVTPKKDRAKL